MVFRARTEGGVHAYHITAPVGNICKEPKIRSNRILRADKGGVLGGQTTTGPNDDVFRRRRGVRMASIRRIMAVLLCQQLQHCSKYRGCSAISCRIPYNRVAALGSVGYKTRRLRNIESASCVFYSRLSLMCLYCFSDQRVLRHVKTGILALTLAFSSLSVVVFFWLRPLKQQREMQALPRARFDISSFVALQASKTYAVDVVPGNHTQL